MPETLHESSVDIEVATAGIVTTGTQPGNLTTVSNGTRDVRDQLVDAVKETEPSVVTNTLTQLAIVSSLVMSTLTISSSRITEAIPWICLLGLFIRMRMVSNKLACAEAALKVNAVSVEAVSHLIDMLVWPDYRIRSIVIYKLSEILQDLDATGLPQLGSNQRSTLHSILNDGLHLPSCKIALKVLEAYGDEESMNIVDSLSVKSRWKLGALRLKRAAEQSAPRLRIAVAKRRDLSEANSYEIVVSNGSSSRGAVLSSAEAQAQAEQAAIHRAKLEEEARSRARPALRTAFLIADWVVIVPYTVLEAITALSHGQIVAAGIWTAATGAAIRLYRFALSPTQSSEAKKLAALSDIKSVGTFAEALDWPDPELSKLSELRLIEMLPLLKASDVGLLNVYQRECLNSALKLSKSRDHSRLLISILKAWEQVGDMKAVPFVEALASSNPRNVWEKEVVAAAEQCLPSLRDSAFGNQQVLQLLRASYVSEATSGELVRPTMSESSTDPAELMRSSRQE